MKNNTQNIQNNTHTEKQFSDILQKITNKEISTHSKTFFRLQWLSFILLVVGICSISILLCSFILFTLQMTGQPHLVHLGSKGILSAFLIFPWILFFIDIFLIILLGKLTRQTSFGYKIPGIYILIAILSIIGISGYIVESKTNFHKHMLMKAEKKELYMFGSMYKNIRKAPPKRYDIYKGVITQIDTKYVLVDIYNEDGISTTSKILIPIKNTGDQLGTVIVGQTVFISGKIIDGKIIHPRLQKLR